MRRGSLSVSTQLSSRALPRRYGPCYGQGPIHPFLDEEVGSNGSENLRKKSALNRAPSPLTFISNAKRAARPIFSCSKHSSEPGVEQPLNGTSNGIERAEERPCFFGEPKV